MAEQLKGVPLSREVQDGFIAHQVAFSEEGVIVFDSTELARERFENRQRIANPPKTWMKLAPGYRTENAAYERVFKADTTRPKAPALSKKPRGYSEGYWQLNQKQLKKQAARRA